MTQQEGEADHLYNCSNYLCIENGRLMQDVLVSEQVRNELVV